MSKLMYIYLNVTGPEQANTTAPAGTEPSKIVWTIVIYKIKVILHQEFMTAIQQFVYICLTDKNFSIPITLSILLCSSPLVQNADYPPELLFKGKGKQINGKSCIHINKHVILTVSRYGSLVMVRLVGWLVAR